MDKLTYTNNTYLDDLHATGFGIPITSIFRLEFYIYTCAGQGLKKFRPNNLHCEIKLFDHAWFITHCVYDFLCGDVL